MDQPMRTDQGIRSRREFLRMAGRVVAAAALCGAAALALRKRDRGAQVWQIDPRKCVQCEGCAANCVREQSAVRCVHEFAMCGYCELCFGFFRPGAKELTSAAENQICPTGAIRRKFVEKPYFEYSIDEGLCIGCGRCVKACGAFGNGSLCLQIRHDLCLDCNECSIARACPAAAVSRRPISEPGMSKGSETGGAGNE